MSHSMHTIETFSGEAVDLIRPAVQSLNIKDIAWSLSRIARFNGHTLGEHPYSVAQHCVWVARAAQRYFHTDPLTTQQALLHDAHEAYTGDICSPLKSMRQLYPVSGIESMLQRKIYIALDIPEPTSLAESVIKACDQYALACEARHLMHSNGAGWKCMQDVSADIFENFWEPMPPSEAFHLFWCAWEMLRNGEPLEDLCD